MLRHLPRRRGHWLIGTSWVGHVYPTTQKKERRGMDEELTKPFCLPGTEALGLVSADGDGEAEMNVN